MFTVGLNLQYINNSLKSLVGGEGLVGWVPLLAQVGPKENEFIHLFSGYLLPPLHSQTLLAHNQALAADAHGGHGQEPQRQAGQPWELVAHRRAPVLEEIGGALKKRLCQVLKNLLSDLALTLIAGGHRAGRGGPPGAAAIVSPALYAAYFGGRRAVGVPLVATRPSARGHTSISGFGGHFARSGNDVFVLVGRH